MARDRLREPLYPRAPVQYLARMSAAGRAGGAVFSPLSQDPLAFWLSAPQHLAADEDGTGAVVADGTVGYRADLTASALHLLQATAGERPLYKTNAGKHWLEFAGADEWMRVAFALPQPWSRISAIRQLSWTGNDRIFGPAASNDRGFLFQNDATPTLALFDGAIACDNVDAAVGVDAVIIEVHDGANSQIIVNAGTPTTGNAGTTATDGLTIAGDGDSPASNMGHFRDYGIGVFARDITADDPADLAQLVAYFSGLCEVPPL